MFNFGDLFFIVGVIGWAIVVVELYPTDPLDKEQNKDKYKSNE